MTKKKRYRRYSPEFKREALKRTAEERPEEIFRLIERLHWVLLTISLITALGAAAGSHGMLF